MSIDQQLATDISRQAKRLAAQLEACQRDLQARCNADGEPLVQSVRAAIERLMRDIQRNSEW